MRPNDVLMSVFALHGSTAKHSANTWQWKQALLAGAQRGRRVNLRVTCSYYTVELYLSKKTDRWCRHSGARSRRNKTWGEGGFSCFDLMRLFRNHHALLDMCAMDTLQVNSIQIINLRSVWLCEVITNTSSYVCWHNSVVKLRRALYWIRRSRKTTQTATHIPSPSNFCTFICTNHFSFPSKWWTICHTAHLTVPKTTRILHRGV